MTMTVAFDPGFIPSLNKLTPTEAQRVLRAVERYQRLPETPGLNVEQLKGRAAKKRLWTFRSSQELRVLLAREGETSVLLQAGHHDEIYNLADRVAFVVPLSGKPGLISIRSTSSGEPDPESHTKRTPLRSSVEGPSILEHWSDAELLRAEFSHNEIKLLRLATCDTLIDVWPDIGVETFERVLECSEKTPESWFQQDLLSDDLRETQFHQAIAERGALGGLSSLLTESEFQRLLSGPIEDWMIFLHPDQRTIVDRDFSGPTRVRGSAGTGKTVVAIHRAAVMAKRLRAAPTRNETPKILFTTFINSLPPVFNNLYKRLPTSIDGVVEFINLDRLARRVCEQNRYSVSIDTMLSGKAFVEARSVVIRPGTALFRDHLTDRYLKEEITRVIKGRGIDSVEEYQSIDRIGRRTRFTSAMREQVWELHQEWNRLLAVAGVDDFADVMRYARDFARQRTVPTYDAAIVDESQDLTLVGLQFVRALVNGRSTQDRPNSLFVVGDGAQKIYPGGFTLAQAGVNVRGNSFVLRRNYRNTREIIDAAMACTGSSIVDDFGDDYRRDDVTYHAHKSGAKPVLVRARSFLGQIAYVVDQVKRLTADERLRLGDIGVFSASNEFVSHAIEGLRRAGIRPQPLRHYGGTSNDMIKVGTFHRAKGLEFRVVFLLNVDARASGSYSLNREEKDEFNAIQMNQLFVAMTRARDGLFLLCNDDPCEPVYEALDCLDEVDL